MPVKTVENWLRGVWKRLSIETDDGWRDATSQVIWLQTDSLFGDIRIPAGRPPFPRRSSLSQTTESEKLALSCQQGFAGVARLDGSICQWHRQIDYQPFSGQRDIGTLHWEGELLIERGVDVSYREEWQRLDDGNGDFTALTLSSPGDGTQADAGWAACLVTAGDYFIYARNRSSALLPASSLSDLLTQVGRSGEEQGHLLDCEIAFGLCRTGRMPWEITLSTLPWRERQPLWEPADLNVDLQSGQVLQSVATSANLQVQYWNIDQWGTGLAFRG